MDEASIRSAVKTERLNLCGLLEQLDASAWAAQSLCEQWTVKEVTAHLTTTTRTGLFAMFGRMARARGNFDRMSTQVARELARRYSGTELVELLRETAGSDRRMPGSATLDPLADVLVHGQDIVRPLGLSHDPSPQSVTAALDHVVDNRFYGNPERLAGVRLVATDADWSSGEGAEVRGSAIDLLIAATGRPAGVERLTGPGAEVLSSRLS